MPVIRKARVLRGANLLLRDVDEQDGEFIHRLRTDPVKSRYLSATASLQDQIDWIKRYQTSNNQAYFIVCDSSGERLGCIRMYDAHDTSYCWGSWLMRPGLSPLVSIESSLLLYAYGRYLGFTEARIDVRQDNTAVWRFHERFWSAELVGQTDLDRFYVVRSSAIEKTLEKYANLLTTPLDVSF